MLSFVKNTILIVNRIATLASGAVLSALILVSALQVIYRYVLMEPAIWTEEAARHLLVWLTFLAAGIALREGMHPRIAVLESRLPEHLKHAVRWLLVGVISAFLIIFMMVTWNVALIYNAYNSLGTGLPQSLPRLALPVGAFLMLINILALLRPPEIDYELSRIAAADEEATCASAPTNRTVDGKYHELTS